MSESPCRLGVAACQLGIVLCLTLRFRPPHDARLSVTFRQRRPVMMVAHYCPSVKYRVIQSTTLASWRAPRTAPTPSRTTSRRCSGSPQIPSYGSSIQNENRYQEATFRAFFGEALTSGGALVALDRANGDIIGS